MRPEIGDILSSVEFAARSFAACLEDRERTRSGVALPLARRAVARRIGVAPGSLENLRRGRVKGVRAWMYEKLRAAFIRECEQEIMRLKHELEMARQCGLDPREGAYCAVETALATARQLIKGAGDGGGERSQ